MALSIPIPSLSASEEEEEGDVCACCLGALAVSGQYHLHYSVITVCDDIHYLNEMVTTSVHYNVR